MLWTAVKRECPRATCLVRPVQVCVAVAARVAEEAMVGLAKVAGMEVGPWGGVAEARGVAG